MTNVYSVKLDSVTPFKIKLMDNSKTECPLVKSNFNSLSQRYFRIDTNHDETTSEAGIPDENKAIKDAYGFYPDRFNDMKYMLVSKNDYKRIHEGNYSVLVEHLDVSTGTTIPPMSFDTFVKNVLKIDINAIQQTDPVPVGPVPGPTFPILDVCDAGGGDNPTKSFYQYLKLYDIHDMSSIFPDGRSSISFHIDSATSDDSLSTVPNICREKYQKMFCIQKLEIPDTPQFNDPNYKQFSFLYFGDLMIVKHYNAALGIINPAAPPADPLMITNGFENFAPFYKYFCVNTLVITGPPNSVKLVALIKCSIIAMNIFWQTLLSYIHIYVKLHDSIHSDNVIEALRHWVFVGINYKDTPSFTGKFIQLIPNDPTNVTYISYWFLHMHHYSGLLPAPPDYQCLNVTNSSVQEFDVIQGECAHLINSVYTHCGQFHKAVPRSKKFEKLNLFKAILEAFPLQPGNTDITHAYNKIIIGIGEILKFSGDMSHKTASLMYKNVFSGLKFKMFTPCVTTIDRPLFLSFFMDNIPGIIVNPNSAVLELSGITNTYGYTVPSLRSLNKTLVSFYLPVLEMDIFNLILKYIKSVNDYIALLNSLYDPKYDLFFLKEYKYRTKRDEIANHLVNCIYQYLTYLTMFNLSLYSSRMDDLMILNDDLGTPFVMNPADIDASVINYHNRYVAGNRINHAWFAYYYSKREFKEIIEARTSDIRFIGLTTIVGHEIINLFLKPQPSITITNTTNAPVSVVELSVLLTTFDYPNVFVIKPEFYAPAPPGPDPRQIALNQNAKKLLNFYKQIVENRKPSHNIDINYLSEIEREFFEKMDLRQELGGLEVAGGAFPANLDAATIFELDTFYKKYLLLDGCTFDDSLLSLCILFKKMKSILDNEYKYTNLFQPLAVNPNDRLRINSEYDNLFLYNYVYATQYIELTLLGDTGTNQNYVSLFNNIVNVGNSTTHANPTEHGNCLNSVFIVKKFVINKLFNGNASEIYRDLAGNVLEGYYLFPVLDFHNLLKTADLTKFLQKKTDSVISDKNLFYDKETISVSILLDILNNFIDYITMYNNLFQLFITVMGPIPDADIEQIFKGVQCKFVIYFALLLFNVKCKYKHVKDIHRLFKHIDKIKFVRGVLHSPQDPAAPQRGRPHSTTFYDPNQIYDVENSVLDPRDGTGLINNADVNVVPAPVGGPVLYNIRIDDEQDIEIIGLFTEDPLYAENANKYNFTRIKALYYISSTHIRNSYKELKKLLEVFFLNYGLLYDNFYQDIVFL
jgi:hypothetical protein